MDKLKGKDLPARVLAFLAKHDGWAGALDYVADLENRTQLAGGGWISVEDRLPLDEATHPAPHSFHSVDVIVTDGERVEQATFESGKPRSAPYWRGWNGYDPISPGEVTHWQPLPTPPLAPTKETES